ncbi:unnamed protein product, partial [Closterium sp. NIES-65]
GRRVFIEYILLGGVNDSISVAHELGLLLQSRNVVVNLIPYNHTEVVADYRPSTPEAAEAFQKVLRGNYGLRTTIRREKGNDIAGACGQLAVKALKGGNLGESQLEEGSSGGVLSPPNPSLSSPDESPDSRSKGLGKHIASGAAGEAAVGAVTESPPYNPGLFGRLALANFRQKLVDVVGWSSPKEGYDGMIEEARRLLQMHPDRKKSEEDAVTILRAHFPPFLLPLFKRFFAPLWSGRVAAVLCAWVTHLACQWLMGPSKVVAIEMEDGRKQLSGVKIEKCKFLDESKCAGSCIHTCKMPTQAFMFQDMGVPLLMEPNFEDFSCEFKFGVRAPPRDTDPVLLTPCLATCPIRFPSRSSSSLSPSPSSTSSPLVDPQAPPCT